MASARNSHWLMRRPEAASDLDQSLEWNELCMGHSPCRRFYRLGKDQQARPAHLETMIFSQAIQHVVVISSDFHTPTLQMTAAPCLYPTDAAMDLLQYFFFLELREPMLKETGGKCVERCCGIGWIDNTAPDHDSLSSKELQLEDSFFKSNTFGNA
jgi:hypothetical protein